MYNIGKSGANRIRRDVMISFNKVSITKKELENIKDCLEGGRICGDCKYTKKVNEWFNEKIHSNFLLTHSGTASLEMAALLCNLKEGDEVITPSYTFVSTVNAFALRGAVPVFVDIDPKTLNIDANKIEEKITDKTKAIFCVHYAGVVCDMDKINEIAKKYHLYVVEDAAQAVGSTYKGIPAGTMSDFGCYSFHETKNYVMGEGGGLVVKDEDNFLRAEIIREKGTNRSQFMRGFVDKYTWHDIGSSYLPSDILAALLYGQLERFDEIMEKRMHVWNTYHSFLEKYEQNGTVIRPFIPEECSHNAHMYYMILNSEEERNEMISYLRENGISAPFHYIPLHLSPMGQKYGYKEGDLPITEKYASRLIRLPLYADMTEEETEEVCKALKKKWGD